MSKAIISIVIALIVLALAPIAIGEKGYVLIAFNDYTIEGTITAFVIAAILLAVFGFVIYKLLRYVFSLYGVTRFKWALRADKRKQTNLKTGVWQFINRDFVGAQKSLAKAHVPEGWENIAQAISARAALEAGNKAEARLHLEQVSEDDTPYIAQMLVESEQAELAKESMEQITKNKKATNLELANFAEYLVAQQDWSTLNDQLSRFEKKHALSDEQWQQLFERYFAALDLNALNSAYGNLPKKLKEKAEFHYLINLASFAPEQTDKSLLKLAKGDKYREIWQVLSKCTNTKLSDLQKFVQTRLKKLPEDETLLLTLAYIAKAQGDFELAGKVFNKVLSKDNANKHWRIAAECFSQTGQLDKAVSLYQTYA